MILSHSVRDYIKAMLKYKYLSGKKNQQGFSKRENCLHTSRDKEQPFPVLTSYLRVVFSCYHITVVRRLRVDKVIEPVMSKVFNFCTSHVALSTNKALVECKFCIQTSQQQ